MTLEERVAALEARKIWMANSGNSSERINTLPLTQGSPYTRRSVFSIELPELKAGDVISARGTFEVTNDNAYNVMAARLLLIGDTGGATTGTDISEAAGFNVTPAMHHGVIMDFGSYVVPADLPAGKRLNMVAYAAASAAPVSGAEITVEQDYGRLEVMVIPAALVA
jgi:hypothetical protein